MGSYAGRLVVYPRRTFVESDRELRLGNALELICGSGLRGGERMGTAMVLGFNADVEES